LAERVILEEFIERGPGAGSRIFSYYRQTTAEGDGLGIFKGGYVAAPLQPDNSYMLQVVVENEADGYEYIEAPPPDEKDPQMGIFENRTAALTTLRDPEVMQAWITRVLEHADILGQPPEA
jgi:hypothetical protein